MPTIRAQRLNFSSPMPVMMPGMPIQSQNANATMPVMPRMDAPRAASSPPSEPTIPAMMLRMAVDPNASRT